MMDSVRRESSSVCFNALCRVALILFLPVVACSRSENFSENTAADPDDTAELRIVGTSGSHQATDAPPVLMDAPQFTLTDQLGNSYGSADLGGRISIVNFIFTRCVATCPEQTRRFGEIQRYVQRWPDSRRVRLVSITVDPENDTPEVLKQYAEDQAANHDQWKFLTGERSQISEISEKGFKLPVSGGGPGVPITHSSKCVLIDANLKIRGFYDGLLSEDITKLLKHVRFTLSEPGQKTSDPVYIARPHSAFDPPWLAQRQAEQLATRDDFKIFHDFQYVDQLDSSGIQFVSQVVPDAARDFKKNHYDHANGIAAGDVDGDGLHDLYFVSQVGGNQLWRNLGSGKFEDITARSGVGLPSRVSVSASFADTDNDGDVDLYVTTTRHGNAFFENDGKGSFRDATADSGLAYSGHSSSSDFFDYNRDGRLDLFVTNVGRFTTEQKKDSGEEDDDHAYWVGMEDAFAGHLFPEWAEPNRLYRNDGKNRFVDVTESVGLNRGGWSGDATPIDFNRDGWMDLYVLNMQGNDQCFLNIEGKRFEEQATKLLAQSVWGGMGVKSADFDNNGAMDLFVTNMHADMWQLNEEVQGAKEKLRPPPHRIPPPTYLGTSRPLLENIFGNALYLAEDGGKYREAAIEMNAENFWPWGLSTGDLNADGFQDAFVTSCMNYPYRYHVNSVLLNEQGKRFRDSEFIVGVEPRRGNRTVAPWFELDCSGKDREHELAAGRSGQLVVCGAIGTRSSVILDIDQDGDLDIVTNDFNTPPQVLISNLSERQPKMRFLKISLVGKESNRDGLGARVTVEIADQKITQVQDGQSGYLSQSKLPLYFGLGTADSASKITVEWPSGLKQELPGPLEINRELVIEEPGQAP